MTPATTQPRQVIRVTRMSEIPIGEGRSYTVAGREIALFRTRGGDVFATQARCPHRGGPLADGITGDGKLLCPLHGFAFRLRDGRALRDECGSLETYETVVTAAGDVFVLVPHHARAAS
jgi:nitrite reductase (NADH) small subunit